MNTTEGITSSHHNNILDSHDFVFSLASGATNMILGLPLNLYVMMLIMRRGALASDFFSFNLALLEIIFSLLIVNYIVFVTLKSFPFFKAFMFSLGLIYTARPFFLCLICVDCYFRVIHPVVFLKYKRLHYKVACSGAVWLVTLGSCIYSMYTYTKPLFLYGFFILNLLCFFEMLFCCLAILRALKLPGPGEMATERTKSNTIKRRYFKTILFIMITMAVNFLLYMAPIPLQCCPEKINFIQASVICTCLGLMVGFIQPLLYLHKNGKRTCFLYFRIKKHASEKGHT